MNPDLYIRDALGDPGLDAYTGPIFWNSPDLWVRNSDDGGTEHQNPASGQDNWVYARVTNRGGAPATSNTMVFTAKEWAGTQFAFPGDYLHVTIGWVTNMPDIAPGKSIIVKKKWDSWRIPKAGSYTCLLAAVLPLDGATYQPSLHVWEHNNLAQKNLAIVELKPKSSIEVEFRIGNVGNSTAEPYRIEALRPEGHEHLGLSIVHSSRAVIESLFGSARFGIGTNRTPPTTTGASAVAHRGVTRRAAPSTACPSPTIVLREPARVRVQGGTCRDGGVEMELAAGSKILGTFGGTRSGELSIEAGPVRDLPEFIDTQADLEMGVDDRTDSAIHVRPGRTAGFPVRLAPHWNPSLRLRITAPADARPDEQYTVDLVQRDMCGNIVGGIAVQVRIRDR